MDLYVELLTEAERKSGGTAIRREETNRRIRAVLRDYRRDHGLPPCGEADIFRDPRGKPFFPGIPLWFSVSHSGPWWICAMGSQPVGADVETLRPVKWQRLAGRFFAPEEQAYLNLQKASKGEDAARKAFFGIWTGKEAFMKYTGEGLSYGLDRIVLAERNRLVFNREEPVPYRILPVELPRQREAPEAACSVCMEKEEPLWIKSR